LAIGASTELTNFQGAMREWPSHELATLLKEEGYNPQEGDVADVRAFFEAEL
jgi:hypothetical protein